MGTLHRAGIEERITVLLVEPFPALTELLTDVLQSEGFRVMQAGDADEAVRQAHGDRPDLIVMHYLPLGVGRTTLEQLHQHPATRGVPVISVGAKDPAPKDMLGRWADAVVPRMPDPDMFLELVWNVVNLRVLGARRPAGRQAARQHAT